MGQQAVVITELTSGELGLEGQLLDIFDRKHGGMRILSIALLGEESSTEGTHKTGNIRTDNFLTRDLLECTKNCIIIEGTSLNDHVLTEFAWICKLNNFKEGVLDNGICKTGGNISYGSAFLLGLLYL